MMKVIGIEMGCRNGMVPYSVETPEMIFERIKS